MSKFSVAVGRVGALCVVLLPVTLAAAPPVPAEDFVVGGGQTSGFVYRDIFVDAHSDPSGGTPSGNVSFLVETVGLVVGGPVTCLGVTGNRALIGFDDALFGRVTVEVVDNGSTGSPPDTFFALPVPTDCLSAPGDLLVGGPLSSGDLVVHDAPPLTSTDQCKHGGWRKYTDDLGQPFTNEGQCVRFVVHLPTPTSTSSTTTTTTLPGPCTELLAPCGASTCGGHCLYGSGGLVCVSVDSCVDSGGDRPCGYLDGAPCPPNQVCATPYGPPSSTRCCLPCP